ncbi:hypothetical protein F4810DRAFT_670322 [Camillea tinctor]|nr:hypothetical protein F4810DRAFT_670322 [Camillea tinctor]
MQLLAGGIWYMVYGIRCKVCIDVCMYLMRCNLTLAAPVQCSIARTSFFSLLAFIVNLVVPPLFSLS